MVTRELKQRVHCVVVELKKEGVEEGWSRSFQVLMPNYIKPLGLLEKNCLSGIMEREMRKKWSW